MARSGPQPLTAQSADTVGNPDWADQVLESAWKRPSPRWIPGTAKLVMNIAREGQSWVKVLDTEDGSWTRIARGVNPRSSPDGRKILYLASQEGRSQLRIYSMEQASDEPIPWHPEGFDGASNITYEWSPDGRRIALGFLPAGPEPAEPSEPSESQVTVEVVDASVQRPTPGELWTIDLHSGTGERVHEGPHWYDDLSWSPSGDVLFAAYHGNFIYGFEYGKVGRFDLEDGSMDVLIEDAGVQLLRPTLSPDGEQLAFLYDPTNLFYPWNHHIAVVSSSGGDFRQLTRDVYVGGAPGWSADGECIYHVQVVRALRQLHCTSLDGNTRQLTSGMRNVEGISPSPTSRSVAVVTQDPYGREELWVMDADGGDPRVVFEFGGVPPEVELGSVSELRWTSFDGLEIAGWVFLPADYDPSRSYPLLTDLHGGPTGGLRLTGSIILGTALEWHLWAARGFVVLVPDYRSSGLYGWSHVQDARDQQEQNQRDFADIMAGVDQVLRDFSVDPNRMVLLGHSYGAILTNWILTQTDRFAVAVSYEGRAEQYMGWGLRGEGGNSSFEWQRLGPPWEVPENYRSSAAATYVDRIRTPTLFVSGETGIDLYHNRFMASALVRLGIPTKLLIYGGEGHSIRNRANVRDLLARVTGWIDFHLPDP